jgi:hypothetical protein
MLENSKNETQSSLSGFAIDGGLARRRLIRAGLVAAPVMLALKSQSALATGATHMSCSAWASLSAAKGCHSSHTQQQVGMTCKNYDYWPTISHSECNKRFHRHSDYRKCVPFDGSEYGDKLLKDICKGIVTTGDSRRDKLSRHCASMYLNLRIEGNCPFDEATIKSIWNHCKNGGSWTPPTGGTPWDRDDCNEYFDYVCTGTKPSYWGNTCA